MKFKLVMFYFILTFYLESLQEKISVYPILAITIPSASCAKLCFVIIGKHWHATRQTKMMNNINMSRLRLLA